MIQTRRVRTREEFEALKVGEMLACTFHRDVVYKKKRVRFGVFSVALNKYDTKEIILDKKDNVYFNYEMFLNGESNLSCAVIIEPQPF